MSMLEALRKQAEEAAQTAENMNEATKGGGGRLLPEGYAFARLVEYVEFGKQPQEFNGKAKEPALEVQLGFALWGEGYQNEDGSPYVIRPWPFAISRNEKAKAYKLFKAMNWKGDKTAFPQLIGAAYLVKIVHNKDREGKVRSSMDLNSILPPLDPVTKAPYPIPEAREADLRFFLWNYPTLEGWDSLYVDGKWDDGRSKNRVQETIVSALDFPGSPIELLLKQAGKAIPTPAPAPAKPAGPVVPTAPGSAAVAPPTAPVQSAPLPSLPSMPSLPGIPQ